MMSFFARANYDWKSRYLLPEQFVQTVLLV